MKHILLILLALLVMPTAVLAQDAPSKERLALSQKMHEIWPMRTRMESALEAVAEGFPEDRRLEMLASMRKSIQFDELEEESIKAMAEIFTEEELKAMIEFYGSETGRAISIKTGDYEMAIRPVLAKMMDKAMMDLKMGTPQ
jgi:hypothetical protein